MAKRYTYESDEIRREYRRLRDRLYHLAVRDPNNYGKQQAYNAVKEALADVEHIDRDTLDDIQDIFDNTIEINNVDPLRYDDMTYSNLREMLYNLSSNTVSQFDQYGVNKVIEMFDNFVNAIGRKAFSDFIDNNPEILKEIETISSIYDNYVKEYGNKNMDWEGLEEAQNACLNTLENLFNMYLNSEAYNEYKAWEAQVSMVYNGY